MRPCLTPHRKEYARWVSDAKRVETGAAPGCQGGHDAATRSLHTGLTRASANREPVADPHAGTDWVVGSDVTAVGGVRW